MAEETTNVENDDGLEGQATEETTIPEVEQEARAMGWRPKEEFEGDESDWIEAEEFVGRAPLYQNLTKQKKRIKRLEKAINDLSEHNRKVQTATREQTIRELKQARKEALREGEADTVDEIDDKIKETEALPIPEEVNQVFQDWLEDNEWYLDDPDKQAIANSYGLRLKQAKPSMSDEDALEKVTEYIKKKFPEEFGTPRSTRIPDGGGGGRSTRTTTYTPTSEEKKMAKEFVELGVFDSEKEYYKQLEAAKRG